MQQVYGTPDYIGGIQAALLNSEATRFRRRYFANGSHLGFILYSTDPDMDDEMEEQIRESIANSKGVGNFKSMFVNIAGGHPDGLKVIPIGDTGKKDEFGTIKDVSHKIFWPHTATRQALRGLFRMVVLLAMWRKSAMLTA